MTVTINRPLPHSQSAHISQVLISVSMTNAQLGQQVCQVSGISHSKESFVKIHLALISCCLAWVSRAHSRRRIKICGFEKDIGPYNMLGLRRVDNVRIIICYFLWRLTLILRRSLTGTVWFYTSTSNKRAARPKLYTKSLTRDLERIVASHWWEFPLTFRHRASCILGQAFHYSPENAFYIFNQQIYFIIRYLLDRASLI